MNQLEVLRESLGQCDEIILDALLMRNRIVEDIMVYKEANNVPILQPEQEAKQKEWLERRMQEKRHKNEVADVFESITRNSKKIQARKLFNYNIVLIGFMGAGKSTISDYLKTVFAMDIIEMDQIIAERAGMSISDIFETYGEQYFRDCETNLLIEMQSRTNVVISCGGGTPMRECNVAEMKKNGRVVLLTAKPETILDRVKDSHDRPLIENNKTVPFIADLMSKRREKYEAAADIIIETDGKSELEIDLVKVGCDDCRGCSACCHGMGDSIVLDPMDVYRLEKKLGKTMEEILLAGNVALRVVDGVILPHLKMTEQSDRCSFLNEEGRCSIHDARPGFCRMFPLGRLYEDGTFSYFLQVNECPKENKTKVKVRRWLDTPELGKYEAFTTKWHYYLKEKQNAARESEDDAFRQQISMNILKLFYLLPYDGNTDFYTQFAARMELAADKH